MKKTTKIIGNKYLIKLSGEVKGLDSIALSDLLSACKEKDYEEIIIDLQKVIYMDSNSLGALVYGKILLDKYNIKITLSADKKNIDKLFHECSLEKIFSIVESYE